MQQFKQSSMQQFKQAIAFDVMFKQPFKVQAVHLSDICSPKLPGTAGKPATGQGSQADTRTYCATQTAQAILGVSDCRACVVGWCHRLSAQTHNLRQVHRNVPGKCMGGLDQGGGLCGGMSGQANGQSLDGQDLPVSCRRSPHPSTGVEGGVQQ
jgi:hypothetical protein